jgi:GNAT superfamily N-acetyltransferase
MTTQIEIVPLQLEHCESLVTLQRLAYPTLGPHELMTAEHYASHYRLCPECQVVAVLREGQHEQVIGAGSGFFIDFDFDHPDHSFQEIIAGGYFTTHDPNGAYYYGADISVHPDYRGHGIGRRIYEARKAITQRYNRRGIVAGGLIPGYAHWKTQLTPHQYVDRVLRSELQDPTLSFQLRNGFILRGLLQAYIEDSASDNWATLIEWPNPDWRPNRE